MNTAQLNTERSEERIRAWMERENPLQRGTLVVKRRVAAPPEVIFPLLCPTLEYDWIPTWERELLHSDSGVAEYDVIFRTRIQDVEEVWVCTHYDPNREIHYVRVNPELVTKLEIRLDDPGDGTTRIRWSILASALSEGMNPVVADLGEDGSRVHILEHLLDDLEHYLETGERRG